MKITNLAALQVLSIVNSEEWFMNKWSETSKIHFYYPVRTALKSNIENIRELSKELVSAKDTLAANNGEISDELKEFLNATNEIEITTYTKEELDTYLKLNGEYLSEADTQILEMFVKG